MCFECDSVWLEDQPVSDQAGATFDEHMQSLGRLPDWKGIEKRAEFIEPARGLRVADDPLRKQQRMEALSGGVRDAPDGTESLQRLVRPDQLETVDTL